MPPIARLTPDQANDFMNGGPPDVRTTLAKSDLCAGGSGIDWGTRCEIYPKRDPIEHLIPFP